MKIRAKKCSRCSCINTMEEIGVFAIRPPKDNIEAMSLDEILSYGELQGNLFQCYMDNNGTKCKGLDEFTTYLDNNQDVYNKLQSNLNIYKEKFRNNKLIGKN